MCITFLGKVDKNGRPKDDVTNKLKAMTSQSTPSQGNALKGNLSQENASKGNPSQDATKNIPGPKDAKIKCLAPGCTAPMFGALNLPR